MPNNSLNLTGELSGEASVDTSKPIPHPLPLTTPAVIRQTVVVTDIQMPFGSMVVFLIKLTIAAIPAALFLGLIWLFVMALLLGLSGGLK